MERRLYEASLRGGAASLSELIKEDEQVLDRVSVTRFDENPLHIAVMRGHLDFTKLILRTKPKLALDLDSQGCSPLHLASAGGYVDIVRELLRVGPDMCLARDQAGRTPLHLAALKGRVQVMTELIRVPPQVTRDRSDHGETLLHLCVKHNRVEALRLLVGSVSDVDFVNAADDDGNTALHLAVANKQLETTKFLIARGGVKVNSSNRNGFTAMDMIEHCPRDLKSMEIRELLRDAEALRSNKVAAMATSQQIKVGTALPNSSTSLKQQSRKHEGSSKQEQAAALMVTATLLAVMSFQAGVNPPGGVWKADGPGDRNLGVSIMSQKSPENYRNFLIFNSISLGASLIIILMVTSGRPVFQRGFCNWVLMAAMFISIVFLAFAYMTSIFEFVPAEGGPGPFVAAIFMALTLLVVLGIFFLVYTIRFVKYLMKRLKLRNQRLTASDQNEGKGYEKLSLA